MFCFVCRIRPDIVDTIFCTATRHKGAMTQEMISIRSRVKQEGYMNLYQKLSVAIGCSSESWVLYG